MLFRCRLRRHRKCKLRFVGFFPPSCTICSVVFWRFTSNFLLTDQKTRASYQPQNKANSNTGSPCFTVCSPLPVWVWFPSGWKTPLEFLKAHIFSSLTVPVKQTAGLKSAQLFCEALFVEEIGKKHRVDGKEAVGTWIHLHYKVLFQFPLLTWTLKAPFGND